MGSERTDATLARLLATTGGDPASRAAVRALLDELVHRLGNARFALEAEVRETRRITALHQGGLPAEAAGELADDLAEVCHDLGDLSGALRRAWERSG